MHAHTDAVGHALSTEPMSLVGFCGQNGQIMITFTGYCGLTCRTWCMYGPWIPKERERRRHAS